MELVPDGITKIDRDDGLVTFLDVTPSTTATYAVLGVGITDYGISLTSK